MKRYREIGTRGRRAKSTRLWVFFVQMTRMVHPIVQHANDKNA